MVSRRRADCECWRCRAFSQAFKRIVTLTLLSSTKEGPVLLEVEVDVDEVGSSEELHDHTRCDNRGDTQLHEGSPVGSENDTHPVEGIRRVRGHDTV